MDFTKKYSGIGGGRWVFAALLVIIFVFIGSEGYSQIDSRNQIRPDREKNFEDPDKKERKRIKSKRNPRFKGKKAYSNKRQLKRSRRDRERQVDRSTKGDITGRKITTKRTPRRTYARPQNDPYKNRRIRTERSRAGAPVAPPRTATKKGERARTGDISGQKRVRQKSVRTERVSKYPQPNPYVGRKIRTEKSRAKSNKKAIRSIRSATKPSESRKPRSKSRPVTATAAPKVKTKRNVYRNHERRGGERSTNKDIAGKKLRTRNTRSAGHIEGGGVISGIDRYEARPRNAEGDRFKKSRRAPGPRSVTRPPETSARIRKNDYAFRRYSRSDRQTGVVIAKKVRSLSQPSRKGEKRIYGSKFNAGSVRSVSGYSRARSRKGAGTPVTLSGRRKRYKQKNTYLGKDRHFGENSSTKDIAGRNLRTRNYKSYNPTWDAKKFRPYSRGSGRLTTEYSSTIPRSSRRAGWNNSGVPLQGRGRNVNSEATAGYKGKMRARGIPKYGRGQESLFSGRKKSKKPLQGGGSITRGWNNGGVPLLKKGRNANSESLAGYQGKMPLSAMPSYGKSREGVYTGKMKAKKPLKGGASITRRWNNKGEPLIGKGQTGTDKERLAYQGNMKAKKRLKGGGGSITRRWNNKGEPLIGKGQTGTDKNRLAYQGNMKAKKRLKGGGGSITRRWNNKGEPLIGKGQTGTDKDWLAYQGKMKAKKRPKGGGGSITRRWNNKGEPLIGKGQTGTDKERLAYQGKMKAKKRPKGGGGSITRRWNNKGEPIEGRRRTDTDEDILAYQGNMKAKKMPKGGGGSITRRWNNKGEPIEGRRRTDTDEDILEYQGDMRAVGRGDIGPSEGMERGRTKSLSFIRLGDPTHMGLQREAHNKKVNNRLPKALSRKERLRMKGAEGLDNGRSRAFTFWAIGNPSHGGLERSPSHAKGRLHPSSTYTASKKSRNSIEEKEQPVKIKIWWAKLFKKNSNQPDSVKEKPKRPRYDKGERSIWETAERPDWYNN